MTDGPSPVSAQLLPGLLGGATWGVRGPVFLALYAALIATVALVVLALRGSFVLFDLRGDAGGPIVDDALALAMMNGGDELVLAVAAADARLDGSPRSALRRAVATRLADEPASTLSQLVLAPGVSEELASLRRSLVADGLLLEGRERARIRSLSAGFVIALIFLGALRIVAGIRNDKPVGFLVLAVAALAFLGLRWALDAPRATPAGRRVLRSSRRGSRTLRKGVSATDPCLGLALALFGAEVLWAAEPALAETLGLARPSSGDGGSGGCGGCGACGG